MECNSKNLRVLLIDDDEDYYFITNDLLSEIQCCNTKLDWAPTYEEGLKLITAGQHDIYLVDYRLGKHTGLDLLRAAIPAGCTAPIIMLTGQGDREVDIEAMNAGASDFLTKGKIDGALLERSIRYALERKRSEIDLKKAKDYSENIINSSVDMIIAVNRERRITEFNRSAEIVYGFKRCDIIGQFIDVLYEDPKESVRIFNNVLAEKEITSEVSQKTHGGKVFPGYISASLLYESGGRQIVGAMYIVRDITEHKILEERLIHDAFHDPLTGLPNRALFMDRLIYLLARTKRKDGYIFAVFFLDLDRFKIINDSLGHMVGDQLLISISDKLKNVIRANDTVARLGGDEFAILLDDIKDPKNVTRIADRVMKTLEKPFEITGQSVFSSASIGIVLSNANYEKPEEILRDADTVMYRAKALGRARYAMFDIDMHTYVMRQLKLEGDMRRALENEEFTLYYQPIVSLETGKIVSLEALLRWQHPQYNLVSPGEFIPIAEETGLIVPLGELVLHKACRQTQIWNTSINPALEMSVNFSARQFQDRMLIEMVRRVINETEVNPERLNIELTESTIMSDMNFNIHVLQTLNKLGIKMSIDDFGTGYSTLSSLKKLPINTLKIDRSFIKDITASPDSEAIAAAIIVMGKTLKLKIVAEGVEQPDELAFLKQNKCDFIQGYIFSRPLPPDEITKLLEEDKTFPIPE